MRATWSLMPIGVRVPSLGEDQHGPSCLLVFVFPMKTTHGHSHPLVFVFQSPARTAHGLSLQLFFVFQIPARTDMVAHVCCCSCSSSRWGPHMVAHARWWLCSNSRRGPTWSLMPVGVCVPPEDHTWSLTPIGIRVPFSDEDRTWSLTPVGIHVLVLGEDCTWSLMPVGAQYLVFWKGCSLCRIYKILWRWSKIFINSIPLSQGPIWEGGVRGGIMSHSRLEPLTFNTHSTFVVLIIWKLLWTVHIRCVNLYIL